MLSGIYAAVQSLRAAAQLVRANKKLARRLADRVESLLPELRIIEQRQRDRDNGHSTGLAVGPLDAQLHTMLLCVQDAAALVQTFGEASWMRRVLSKGDYAGDFAAINERLATAQADLGFGVQVDALIVAEQDADDAKADLEAIREMLPILMTAVQEADAAAERRHLSQAERQIHQAQMLAAMQAQLDGHLARAELRSIKARVARQSAAAAVGTTSAHASDPTPPRLPLPSPMPLPDGCAVAHPAVRPPSRAKAGGQRRLRRGVQGAVDHAPHERRSEEAARRDGPHANRRFQP